MMSWFRKKKAEEPATGVTSTPTPEPPAEGSLAGRAQVEERLFAFAMSLRDGRPQAPQALMVEGTTIQSLCADPPAELVEALRHVLDNSLIELGPDPAAWGTFELPPAVLGILLAAYECLTPAPALYAGAGVDAEAASGREAAQVDLVAEFATALVQSLPPARTLHDALAYHAILQSTAEALPDLPRSRADLLSRLVNLSPLTALYCPHLYTPPPLAGLAAELLRNRKGRAAAASPWRDLDDWLDALEPILDHPALAARLRRRWLVLPETHVCCRNLGLLFEAMRRRGRWRDFLLEFYEACDYLRGEPIRDVVNRSHRRWRLIDEEIAPLLQAGADDDDSRAIDVATRLNRRGREFFLLFYPLLQLVIAEGRRPTDYPRLTLEFILKLTEVSRWARYGEAAGPSIDLGAIDFTSS